MFCLGLKTRFLIIRNIVCLKKYLLSLSEYCIIFYLIPKNCFNTYKLLNIITM